MSGKAQSNPPTAEKPINAVDLEAVSRVFTEGTESRVILDRLDFQAGRGQFIAIGGPSGSGKSTLLNIIAGLDVADSGNVWINGENLSALDAGERTRLRRRQIGLVFQFFNLVPTLTVAENLKLPLLLNGIAEDKDHIDDLMQEFDLYPRRNDYPDTLSGGEQQRVAVVRAAVHSPALVLADEPTGNLDRERGEQVIALLSQLSKRDTCVVMVTHSRRAAGHADRRLRVSEGRLSPWNW